MRSRRRSFGTRAAVTLRSQDLLSLINLYGSGNAEEAALAFAVWPQGQTSVERRAAASLGRRGGRTNDFYRKYLHPEASDAQLMRVARRSTVVWGVVQIAVALAAQWMDRSVLDAGLAVLSLAAGPVLGAFLIGVLNRSVGSRAMLAGMAAGMVVLVAVWWTAAVAWTWYAFVGAAVTMGTALAASRVSTFRTE